MQRYKVFVLDKMLTIFVKHDILYIGKWKSMISAKRTYAFIAVASILGVAFFGSQAVANTTLNQVSYSGTLTDTNGDPLADGTYGMEFRLYDTETGSGTGSETDGSLWESTYNGEDNDNTTDEACNPISIEDGHFEVSLGECESIPFDVINNTDLYLDVRLDDTNLDQVSDPDTHSFAFNEEFSPRRKINSTLSALNALQLISQGENDNTLEIRDNGDLIFEGNAGSGRVGLGTSNPLNQLTVSGDADVTGNLGIGTTSPDQQLSIGQSGVGLNNPSDNVLSFATNGSEQIRIDDQGRLGLGTINPNRKLHVAGDAFFEEQVILEDEEGNTNYIKGEKDQGESEKDGLLLSSWATIEANIDNNDAPSDGFKVSAGSDRNEIFRVNGDDGNVGIGTDTPNQKLSIGQSGVGLNNPASNELSFATNGSEQMRIDQNGNLGIGTTNPDNPLTVSGNADVTGNLGIGVSNPVEKLAVDGDMRLEGPINQANQEGRYYHNTPITPEGGDTNNVMYVLLAETSVDDQIVSGRITASTSVNASRTSNSIFDVQARVFRNGDVSGSFSSIGNASSQGNSKLQEPQLKTVDYNGTNWIALEIEADDGNDAQYNALNFSGRLSGLDPEDLLYVSGGTTSNEQDFDNSSPFGGSYAYTDVDNSRLSGNMIVGGDTVEEQLTVYGSGYFSDQVYATNFNTTSDQRLKENFDDISTALDKIEQLEGYTFDWKDDTKNGNNRDIGFKAQEVNEVFPELVNYNAERDVYSMSYGGMSAVLTEGIKELYNNQRNLQFNLNNLTFGKDGTIGVKNLEVKEKLKTSGLVVTADGRIEGDLEVQGNLSIQGGVKMRSRTLETQEDIDKGIQDDDYWIHLNLDNYKKDSEEDSYQSIDLTLPDVRESIVNQVINIRLSNVPENYFDEASVRLGTRVELEQNTGINITSEEESPIQILVTDEEKWEKL